MPSIDELLGLSVEELEALTDEQLLERYASIFQLEPQVPLESEQEGNKENGEEDDSGVQSKLPRNRKMARKSEAKAKIADLKAKLMEASKKGLTADQAFEEDFKDL